MASLVCRPNGRKEVQFTDPNGKRKTVRLGRIAKRPAESIKTHIEHLLTSKISKRPVDGETARWVASLDEVLSARIAAVGLISCRESSVLGDFITNYVESRSDLKPRTVKKLNATKDYLIGFFNADKSLREISLADADDWRVFLVSKGLAENTVRKHAQIAKQFFNAAKRRKLVDSNPFRELKSTVKPNPDRYHFVSRATAFKILDSCPNNEWRLIFALARFGGLRCPSELLNLTWNCVDWERERIRIKSPKTEHHTDKSSRQIPIFPELKKYLDIAFFELDGDESVFVIKNYRDAGSNLRTQLTRIIENAGEKPWPKLFQNLRSTRETELAENYPIHVVCHWLGNSNSVASKHYLQVTESHFEKATQNPTQTVHDSSDSDRQPPQDDDVMSEGSDLVGVGQAMSQQEIAVRGLEPPRP